MAAKRVEQEDRTLADLVEAYKDKLLIIVFYARWCKPCRKLINLVLPTVAKRSGERVVICPINVEGDENYFAFKKLGATHIPATLFFREGREISRISGIAKSKVFIHVIKCYQP